MNEVELQYAQFFETISFGFAYDKDFIIKNAKGIRVIRFGNYKYELFNICYLHDILSQILQTIYEGYIPRVEMANGGFDWDLFFEQPFYEYPIESLDLPITYAEGRVSSQFGPMYKSVYIDWERTLSCKLYRDFAVINEKTFTYISQEYATLMQGKNVLGVLCRGTDFLQTKPKGHPVQPSFKEIIDESRKMMMDLDCQYIYLATEEKRIEEIFEKEFPNQIIVNKRQYIDEEYYEMCQKNKNTLIADLMKDKEAEYYERGREYLSSIILLSACKGLVAGNCGGSNAALFYNDYAYEKVKIFELGNY